MAQQIRTLATKAATATTAPTHRTTPRARHERLSWEVRARQARVIESLSESMGFDAVAPRTDYFSITPGIGYGG